MTNRSIALPSDLSYEAATIADASIVVKARLIEAADTMAHLDVGRLKPAAIRTFWPQAPGDTIGGHDVGYGINGHRVQYRPSAAAISRAEEVSYAWMLDFVEDDERRVILGKWAMCLAAPHLAGSFREFCKKTGRVRRTAERRIDQQTQAIAAAILRKAQSLQAPNWSRVSPLLPNQGKSFDKLATVTNWMAPGAKPTHRTDLLEPLPDIPGTI
ncbi:conserved protein of unknown function [Aminobacter niigataensis]|nr:conserved protein of unknown function [Aminobacter niigataensis]